MGKIRVKILGDEGLENQQKQKARLASEAKRAHKNAGQKKLVKGTKGGERVVSVGPSEEELSKIVIESSAESGVNSANQSQADKAKTDKLNSGNSPRARLDSARLASIRAKRGEAGRKRKADNRSRRSKSYRKAMEILDRSKKYSLPGGLDILEKLKRSKFDETVELHINTVTTGLSVNTTLPHGIGKQIRVAIADPSASSGQVDDLLKKIEQGIIEFDVLLATPTAMPKLARVAKILGPKGLMPNPKNATLVKDPQKALEAFKKGQVNFKTETKTPIMHLTVGKMSFGAKKLTENINAVIEAIKKEKILDITLKSTMSPGIRLDLAKTP